MAKPVKFVFNRPAFQQQVLRGKASELCRDAAERAVNGKNLVARAMSGKTRDGAVLIELNHDGNRLNDAIGGMSV